MPNLAIRGGEKLNKRLERKASKWVNTKVFAKLVARKLALHASGKRGTFGDDFARYVGVRHAIPLASGTAALVAGLSAARVGPGDEVITVSFTWTATVAAILAVNAIPIFADIDPRTFTIDPEDVKRKITPRTRAILPVDIYGHPAPLDELRKIASEHQLLIIDDAAQATGARIGDRRLGSIADITAFSFAGKPLSSSSGGILTTDDDELFQRAILAGQHQKTTSRLVTIEELRDHIPFGTLGVNHRMDIHAVKIAHAALPKMEEQNEARIAVADFLTEELSKIEGITPPYVAPGCRHVYHRYTCLFDEAHFGVSRDLFIDALLAEGLDTGSYMDGFNYLSDLQGKPVRAGPIYYRKPFQDLDLYGKGCPFRCPYGERPNYEIGSLPVTDDVTRREFNFIQQQISGPKGKTMAKMILRTIRKVVDNMDELRDMEKARRA